MELTKKNILITGASKGIGAAIAKNLDPKQYRVFLNARTPSAHLEATLIACRENGVEAVASLFNVSDSQSVKTEINAIEKNHGPIYGLINNAGINDDQLLMRVSDEAITRMLDTNVKGSIFTTREVARGMMKARDGVILFMSSVVGEMGNPGQSIYALTKAAQMGFCKSVAKELASRNIRANVVSPGFVDTEMTQNLTEIQKNEIVRHIPLGKMAHSDQIASVVSFLLSKDASYITGQVIGVNGGLFTG